ncbi:MAG TPA: HEPN domain-containing protein [Conexibacter sp.]
MSRPEQPQHAHRLLRKARSDLAAARALAGDADQADEVVGFHVQQAVEKSVKAVMASLDLDYPRTHDIDYLVRQLTKHNVAVPDLLLEARWVSMWGVFTRYDDLDTVLDRAAAIDVATVAIEWACSAIPAGPNLQ